MTESRKIQLVTEVDASGAVQGFRLVKEGARDMAQSVAQSGQTAGRGIDAIGDGAKRAGDGMTREEGRIRSAIQRATLDLKTLGQAASQKLEAKIDLQGLDPAKFQPFLAALREAEQEQARAQAGAKGEAFLGDLSGQLAALREQQVAADGGAQALLRYRAAQLGVGETAAPLIAQINGIRTAMAEKAAADAQATASAKEQAAALKQQAAAQENFLASLRERAATAGLDTNAQLRARASQLGVSEQAEPLISQAAAAQTLASQQAFLSSLKQQAEAIGKTRADLLAMQAAEHGVTAEAAPYIARLREMEQGHQKLGAGAKLTAFQTQQLGFQVHDFVVQVVSGQNPLTAFVQQGSQLSGTFGGAGNAFRAVLSLITPFRVGMAAAAVAVGALVLELVHAESKLRDLSDIQAQFAGQGKVFSTDEIDNFVKKLAKVPGVTEESARAIVSEFSKVGGVSRDVFTELGGLVADYAKATGTKLPEAAKTLTQAIADPEKGAGDLAKTLEKFPISAQFAAERLARLGDTAGAQRAILQGLEQAIQGVNARGMTPLQTSIDGLRKAWDGAMNDLDQSQGLRTINALLAAAIGSVKWLLENAPKLGGIGNLATATIGPLAPAAIGTAVGSFVRSKAEDFLGIGGGPRFEGRGATGSFDAPKGGSASSGAASGSAGPLSEDAFNTLMHRQLEVAKANRDEAGQIKELTEKRAGMNKALQESIDRYGRLPKDPDVKAQQDLLRSGVRGINDKIANLAKKGGGNEDQQVLDARLQGKVKEAQEALAEERSQMAFQQQFLQNVYNQGELGLSAFFDAKVKAIEQGRDAEIAALETERKAVQEHLAATLKTSPKDKSKIEQDNARLKDIGDREAKLTADAARQTVLANVDRTASFRALNQQIEEYRANLLQMQGDELGAARARNRVADQQDKVLAGQSKDSAEDARRLGITLNPITDKDLAAAKRARDNVANVADAKMHLSVINEQLSQQEERIAFFQSKGAVDEVTALQSSWKARQAAVRQMEEYVQKLEKAAAEDELLASLEQRPINLQLQVDTSRARLELDKLKESLDPLKEKFDNLFRDTGRSAIEDLLNGKFKGPLDALKQFATSIAGGINKQVADSLSQQLFGKGGLFGNAGGLLADLFRPKNEQQHVDLGLEPLRAQVDPAAAAIGRMTDAAEAFAVRIQNPQGLPLPPVADGTATAGDFARFDRAYSTAVSAGAPTAADTGERRVLDLFKAGSEQVSKADATAATAALQLASAATRGGGALSVLPQVVQTIVSSLSVTNAASSGGGLFGFLGNLFGGGSSTAIDTSIQNIEIGPGMILHSGGIVGQATGSAARSLPAAAFADAPRYHDGGIVARSGQSGAQSSEILRRIVHEVPRYHEGGPVVDQARPQWRAESRSAPAGLNVDEVPAILMGGPKGKREEVLRADDPRHVDNLPRLVQMIAVGRQEQQGTPAQQVVASPGSALPAREPAHAEDTWRSVLRSAVLDVSPSYRMGGQAAPHAGAASALAPMVLASATPPVFNASGQIAARGQLTRQPVDETLSSVIAPALLDDTPRYHVGGIVGRQPESLPALVGAVAVGPDAPRYHVGGTVQALRKRLNLQHDEVPAILMGGPKGKREEVLRADDPRHQDNLSPALMRAILGRSHDSEPETIAPLPKYHTGGLVGEEADVLATPAVLQYLQPAATADMRGPGASLAEEAAAAASGETHYHNYQISVHPPAGMSRATAHQTGNEIARGIERARRRS